MKVKENECKEKRRYDWCASKEKNIDGHGESQGNRDTAAYTTTPDHNIQSMTQGMTHALHADQHLRRMMDSDSCSLDWWVQFYVSPYAHIQSMLNELRRCFLKKRIIGVREESRAREQEFQELSGGREEKVIKKIREHFEKFFYQKENFNFYPFRRKLKFHIFCYLKFCFLISKI